MKQLIFIFTIVVAIIIYYRVVADRKQPVVSAEKNFINYQYSRKECFMTEAERNFFSILSQTFQGQYYVFPQVHLSTILEINHEGNASRKASFRHINQKSVDFVFCDKQNVRPLVAIELDDWSHHKQSRQKRDAEVERIFADADLPLVRFADYKSLTVAAIEDKLRSAMKR